MARSQSSVLSRGVFSNLRRESSAIRVDPLVVESARLPIDALFEKLSTRPAGLRAWI